MSVQVVGWCSIDALLSEPQQRNTTFAPLIRSVAGAHARARERFFCFVFLFASLNLGRRIYLKQKNKAVGNAHRASI